MVYAIVERAQEWLVEHNEPERDLHAQMMARLEGQGAHLPFEAECPFVSTELSERASHPPAPLGVQATRPARMTTRRMGTGAAARRAYGRAPRQLVRRVGQRTTGEPTQRRPPRWRPRRR